MSDMDSDDIDNGKIVQLEQDETEALVASLNVNEQNSSNGNDTTIVDMGDCNENDKEEDAFVGIVTSFCDITGSDPISARTFLEALSWDLESAVSLYVGQEIQEEQPEPSNRQNLSSFVSLPSMQDHDHRMGGIPSPPRMEETQIADKIMKNLLAAQHISSGAVNYGGVEFGGYADSDDDLRKVDEYDEQGVRRPDPVKQQVLLGGRFMREEDDEDILARAEDSSVEWLFDPPRHLSSLGNLEQARTMAGNQKRWLVVNIQSHFEFSSNLLNRDTWSDETVGSFMTSTFLLWQRGHTSRDGAVYMRVHRITEDDLPHIGVIDPRTGAKLLTIKGFLGAQELSSRLLEFSEKFSLESNSNAKAILPSSASSRASSFANSISSTDTIPYDGPTVSNNATPPLSGDRFQLLRSENSTLTSAPFTDGIAAMTSDIVEKDVDLSGMEKAVALDYGPVPDEPTDSNAKKVSIRLVNGKSLARKYNPHDPVRYLYAVAASAVPESSTWAFDIMTSYPTRANLSDSLDKSIEECGLFGSQLIMQWS